MTWSWLVKRLLWMGFTLLGITMVTFAVLDLAPVDRATVEIARAAEQDGFVDAPAREAAILGLRLRYGTIDPTTYEPLPLSTRYLAWLGQAVQLDFAGPNEDPAALWARFWRALPVTMLLGVITLMLAFGVGIPLGCQLAARAGSRCDRVTTRVLLAITGMPDYLFGTLCLLLFAGLWLPLFPNHGLRSPGAEDWHLVARIGDFAWHLILPVTVMALGPLVAVMRFVRDAYARAAAQPFAAHWLALGVEPAVMERRLRHHAIVPVATLAGGMLPLLVSGSVVVERLFGLDGLGHLTFTAAREQEQSMVMLVVCVGALATLSSLVVSDVMHRLIDPRVRLQA